MRKASNVNRFVAYIIDDFIGGMVSNILVLPFYCIFLPISVAADEEGSTMDDTAVFFIFMCLFCCGFALMLGFSYLYYVWYPVKKWNGATLGKKIMKIRIVNQDGSNVSQLTMLGREIIGKFISGIVFFLGYIWILVDEKEGKAWHDSMFGTRVIEAE